MNDIESEPNTKWSLSRRIFIAVASAGVIALVIAAVCIVVAIRTALTAEGNYGAFLHAHRATLEFIERYDGQWPKSWDDLRAMQPDSDFDWVAEHVIFDFAADPHEIITQNPDTFTAIEPNEPCYIIDDYVQQLSDMPGHQYGQPIETEHAE